MPRFEDSILKDTDISLTAYKTGSATGTFEYEGEDWRILELEGLSAPELEIFSEKRGVGHGVYITGKRYDAREINIKARAQKSSIEDIRNARKGAVDFHNAAGNTFKLVVYRGRWFAVINDCELQGIKIEQNKPIDKCNIEVSFLSPNAGMITGRYYAANVQPTGDVYYDTYKYYPLVNCYPEKASIRYIRWKTETNVTKIYYGPGRYDSLYLDPGDVVPAGSVLQLIPDIKNNTITLIVDNKQRKVWTDISSSDMKYFQTQSGTETYERVALYTSDGTTGTQPSQIRVEYARWANNSGIGI